MVSPQTLILVTHISVVQVRILPPELKIANMRKNCRIWTCICGNSFEGRKAYFEHRKHCEQHLTWAADFRKRKIEATIKYNKTRQYHHSEETKRKIGKASSKLVHTEETKRRIGESNSKQIICVETGEIFKSAKDCAKHFNVKTQNIYCVTNGKHKYTNINGKRLSFKLI